MAYALEKSSPADAAKEISETVTLGGQCFSSARSTAITMEEATSDKSTPRDELRFRKFRHDCMLFKHVRSRRMVAMGRAKRISDIV